MQSVRGSGDKMSTKRSAPESSDEESEVPEKQSRRQRSSSEPHNGSANANQEVLDDIFRKFCENDGSSRDEILGGENKEEFKENPLLIDAVPECLDPEQLGFLLCAQETLYFLRATGAQGHELYVHLHSRFLEVLEELGVA